MASRDTSTDASKGRSVACSPSMLDPFKSDAVATSPMIKAWWSRQCLSNMNGGSEGALGSEPATVKSEPSTNDALPYRTSARGEPSTAPSWPNWWHDPWDTPDGIRTLLLRGIPANMASVDIVLGWCALYGDVASIDLKPSLPPAPAATTDKEPLLPPTTFAVVMFFKESDALKALRHIDSDVFGRINVRISARPFPTVLPDSLHRPVSSTLVITGTGHVGLQELLQAVNVDVLKVQGVFFTTSRRVLPGAKLSAADAATAPTEPADDLCIVLQFDDARMCANVHNNLCAQAEVGPVRINCGEGPQTGNGQLKAFYWNAAAVAWPTASTGNGTTKPPGTLSSKAVQRPQTAGTHDAVNDAATENVSTGHDIWGGQPMWTPARVLASSPAATVQRPQSGRTTQAAPAPVENPAPEAPASPATVAAAPVSEAYAVAARRAVAVRAASVSEEDAESVPSPLPERPLLNSAIGSLLSSPGQHNTIMIKNIPNKYTPRMILSLLNETHLGRYTTFYLPIDPKNVCNIGYFFLDVIDARVDIPPLIARFQGKRWPHFNSLKTADIAIAALQGQDALLTQVSNSKRQWTTRAFNPYRPRLFYTSGAPAGTEIPWFTVTPEEARTGSVLEVRPGKPVDPSVADDIVIADVCPAIVHGTMPRDMRGKLGRYLDASPPGPSRPYKQQRKSDPSDGHDDCF